MHGPTQQLGRTCAATQKPAPGFPPPNSCSNHVRSMRVTRHSPGEQRAGDAEIIVSKGFDFPDDLIPQICRAQISITGPGRGPSQGKKGDRKLTFYGFKAASLMGNRAPVAIKNHDGPFGLLPAPQKRQMRVMSPPL